MKKEAYIQPMVVERKTRVRTSILAGSNGAFNGVPGGTVNTPPSMTIESRKRVKFEM